MPNRTELMHAPKDRRGGYLQKALWQGQMAFAILLFAYCVEAFKRKPTKQKSIYILRRTGDSGESRIAINYKEVIKGGSRAQNIKLEPGDTIVVP